MLRTPDSNAVEETIAQWCLLKCGKEDCVQTTVTGTTAAGVSRGGEKLGSTEYSMSKWEFVAKGFVDKETSRLREIQAKPTWQDSCQRQARLIRAPLGKVETTRYRALSKLT